MQFKSWQTDKIYTWLKQRDGSSCCICGIEDSNKGRRFDVDHNHTTGKVRQLLCHRCNMIVEKLENNKHYADAVLYLQRHK